jgi:hypothetical protein
MDGIVSRMTPSGRDTSSDVEPETIRIVSTIPELP